MSSTAVLVSKEEVLRPRLDSSPNTQSLRQLGQATHSPNLKLRELRARASVGRSTSSSLTDSGGGPTPETYSEPERRKLFSDRHTELATSSSPSVLQCAEEDRSHAPSRQKRVQKFAFREPPTPTPAETKETPKPVDAPQAREPHPGHPFAKYLISESQKGHLDLPCLLSPTALSTLEPSFLDSICAKRSQADAEPRAIPSSGSLLRHLEVPGCSYISYLKSDKAYTDYLMPQSIHEVPHLQYLRGPHHGQTHPNQGNTEPQPLPKQMPNKFVPEARGHVSPFDHLQYLVEPHKQTAPSQPLVDPPPHNTTLDLLPYIHDPQATHLHYLSPPPPPRQESYLQYLLDPKQAHAVEHHPIPAGPTSCDGTQNLGLDQSEASHLRYLEADPSCPYIAYLKPKPEPKHPIPSSGTPQPSDPEEDRTPYLRHLEVPGCPHIRYLKPEKEYTDYLMPHSIHEVPHLQYLLSPNQAHAKPVPICASNNPPSCSPEGDRTPHLRHLEVPGCPYIRYLKPDKAYTDYLMPRCIDEVPHLQYLLSPNQAHAKPVPIRPSDNTPSSNPGGDGTPHLRHLEIPGCNYIKYLRDEKDYTSYLRPQKPKDTPHLQYLLDPVQLKNATTCHPVPPSDPGTSTQPNKKVHTTSHLHHLDVPGCSYIQYLHSKGYTDYLQTNSMEEAPHLRYLLSPAKASYSQSFPQPLKPKLCAIKFLQGPTTPHIDYLLPAVHSMSTQTADIGPTTPRGQKTYVALHHLMSPDTPCANLLLPHHDMDYIHYLTSMDMLRYLPNDSGTAGDDPEPQGEAQPFLAHLFGWSAAAAFNKSQGKSASTQKEDSNLLHYLISQDESEQPSYVHGLLDPDTASQLHVPGLPPPEALAPKQEPKQAPRPTKLATDLTYLMPRDCENPSYLWSLLHPGHADTPPDARLPVPEPREESEPAPDPVPESREILVKRHKQAPAAAGLDVSTASLPTDMCTGTLAYPEDDIKSQPNSDLDKTETLPAVAMDRVQGMDQGMDKAQPGPTKGVPLENAKPGPDVVKDIPRPIKNEDVTELNVSAVPHVAPEDVTQDEKPMDWPEVPHTQGNKTIPSCYIDKLPPDPVDGQPVAMDGRPLEGVPVDGSMDEHPLHGIPLDHKTLSRRLSQPKMAPQIDALQDPPKRSQSTPNQNQPLVNQFQETQDAEQRLQLLKDLSQMVVSESPPAMVPTECLGEPFLASAINSIVPNATTNATTKSQIALQLLELLLEISTQTGPPLEPKIGLSVARVVCAVLNLSHPVLDKPLLLYTLHAVLRFHGNKYFADEFYHKGGGMALLLGQFQHPACTIVHPKKAARPTENLSAELAGGDSCSPFVTDMLLDLLDEYESGEESGPDGPSQPQDGKHSPISILLVTIATALECSRVTPCVTEAHMDHLLEFIHPGVHMDCLAAAIVCVAKIATHSNPHAIHMVTMGAIGTLLRVLPSSPQKEIYPNLKPSSLVWTSLAVLLKVVSDVPNALKSSADSLLAKLGAEMSQDSSTRYAIIQVLHQLANLPWLHERLVDAGAFAITSQALGSCPNPSGGAARPGALDRDFPRDLDREPKHDQLPARERASSASARDATRLIRAHLKSGVPPSKHLSKASAVGSSVGSATRAGGPSKARAKDKEKERDGGSSDTESVWEKSMVGVIHDGPLVCETMAAETILTLVRAGHGSTLLQDRCILPLFHTVAALDHQHFTGDSSLVDGHEPAELTQGSTNSASSTRIHDPNSQRPFFISLQIMYIMEACLPEVRLVPRRQWQLCLHDTICMVMVDFLVAFSNGFESDKWPNLSSDLEELLEMVRIALRTVLSLADHHDTSSLVENHLDPQALLLVLKKVGTVKTKSHSRGVRRVYSDISKYVYALVSPQYMSQDPTKHPTKLPSTGYGHGMEGGWEEGRDSEGPVKSHWKGAPPRQPAMANGSMINGSMMGNPIVDGSMNQGQLPVVPAMVPDGSYGVPVQRGMMNGMVPVGNYGVPLQNPHGMIATGNYGVPVQNGMVPVQTSMVPMQNGMVPAGNYGVPVQGSMVPLQGGMVPLRAAGPVPNVQRRTSKPSNAMQLIESGQKATPSRHEHSAISLIKDTKSGWQGAIEVIGEEGIKFSLWKANPKSRPNGSNPGPSQAIAHRAQPLEVPKTRRTKVPTHTKMQALKKGSNRVERPPWVDN